MHLLSLLADASLPPPTTDWKTTPLVWFFPAAFLIAGIIWGISYVFRGKQALNDSVKEWLESKAGRETLQVAVKDYLGGEDYRDREVKRFSEHLKGEVFIKAVDARVSSEVEKATREFNLQVTSMKNELKLTMQAVGQEITAALERRMAKIDELEQRLWDVQKKG